MEKILIKEMLNDSFWIMPATPDFIDDGVPYITSKNIKEGQILMESAKYISEDDYNRIAKNRPIETNDILISMIGTLGEAAIVKSEHCRFYGQNVYLLRLNDKKINHKFFLFFINSLTAKRHLESNMNQSTQRYLKAEHIESLELPNLSLEEQIEAVKILDTLSKIISSRKEQLSELDTLIKSRFIEMFGDPVINNMRWDVVKLKKLSTKILSGNTPKGGSQVYVDDGIMFFRSQNVWKNRIELDDIAYIDEKTHKSMAKSSLKHKDILMTKTGRINTENSSLGRAAMYMGADDQANINGHVYMIRMNDKAVKEFVLFIITTLEYRDYIRSVCVGGIDKRQLNKNHIEDFPIIMPPRDKQEEFVSIWKRVNKLKVKVQESLEENQILFDLLMQKYFD